MVKRFLTLAGFLILPLLIGSISGFITSAEITSWYAYLQKPVFNPPNWIFGPVWTSLYLLMGYSAYRIYQNKSSANKKLAYRLFTIQLILNFFWSILFFGLHLIGIALLEISCLWICILAMIIQFKTIDKTAAYLNIPYLLWVSFATILNAAIWYLN